MPDIRDILPAPPWEGLPVPRGLARKSNPESGLPEVLQDRLIEASNKINTIIMYFEVERPGLLERDPGLRDIVTSLEVMISTLAKIRGRFAVYKGKE